MRAAIPEQLPEPDVAVLKIVSAPSGVMLGGAGPGGRLYYGRFVEQLAFDSVPGVIGLDYVVLEDGATVWVNSSVGSGSDLIDETNTHLLICAKMAGQWFALAKLRRVTLL